jgi:hypothetical protein
MDTTLGSNPLLLSVVKHEVKQLVEREHSTAFQSLRVGTYARKLDRALPQPHTKSLYDDLKYEDASVLVQLRTGDNWLNAYLARVC